MSGAAARTGDGKRKEEKEIIEEENTVEYKKHSNINDRDLQTQFI